MNWEDYKVEPKTGKRPDRNLKPESKRSMCVRCWEVFSTERNFDKHLKGTAEDRFCVSPDAVGLKQRENGDWVSADSKSWE